MFSPTDERPKKPVPMVMVGARNVSKPGRAGRAADIDRDAQHVHLRAEAQDDRRVARMDRGRMAGALRFRTMARQAVSAASRVAAS